MRRMIALMTGYKQPPCATLSMFLFGSSPSAYFDRWWKNRTFSVIVPSASAFPTAPMGEEIISNPHATMPVSTKQRPAQTSAQTPDQNSAACPDADGSGCCTRRFFSPP